ncbi:hypothetical protein CQW23_20565 [Capsicum baccatum]|uniref:Uncharacterized protein n=1 Tax=Capsicum baccatum TaxID=33114 RepID=A0A2G2W901_CAPBA|nr:hypothetical protein CQW23_20565 [Capsicum baccatum]
MLMELLQDQGNYFLEWIADKSIPYSKAFAGSLVFLEAKKRYLQESAISVLLELIDKRFILFSSITIHSFVFSATCKHFRYLKLLDLKSGLKPQQAFHCGTSVLTFQLLEGATELFHYSSLKRTWFTCSWMKVLASEIGPIEDEESVGAVGTSVEFFGGWVVDSGYKCKVQSANRNSKISGS